MPTESAYFCLARFAEGERVTVVAAAPYAQDNSTRYVVRNELGREYVVNASDLSDVPPEEFYRSLRPATRVPVRAVRLA